MDRLKKNFLEIDRLPNWLVCDLRSDHAGEVGAVCIYQGILAVSRSSELRDFAQAHLVTEQKHLCALEEMLPPHARSRFILFWRLAGFLTGAIPALFGKKATYATIAAVETFVDQHYQEQIDLLQQQALYPELAKLLESFRLDEVAHQREAAEGVKTEPGWLLNTWCGLVSSGSAVAVSIAKWG
ncbi:MAG: demethoxyubiquinone hydroxylase family protein [Pseudohongiellaceae bacterium]